VLTILRALTLTSLLAGSFYMLVSFLEVRSISWHVSERRDVAFYGM
jgi:hypothetical protein